MATTEEFKNGGASSYEFSIEYIKAEDIKVKVDGTALTYTATNPPAQTTEYTVNSSYVILKQASVSGSTSGGVHIYRETALDASDSATFVAGSSIRAADLNANHTLLRYAGQEKNQVITEDDIRDGAISTSKIRDLNVTREKIANDAIDSTKLADNAVGGEHYQDGSINLIHMSANSVDSNQYVDGSIDHVHLANDVIDGDNIQNSVINSEHYVDGSIDREHLAADIVDSTKIADNAIGAEHIQANSVSDSEIVTGTLDNRYFTETEITDGTALDGRYYTETELDDGQLDNRYYTENEAEDLFLRQDSSETISSGDIWSASDSKVATSAAIDLRIIDLVDDVGGFVAVNNETSFPTANPDVNNGTGTIVSVKAASTDLTPSGTTVTIANGAGTGNTVTITGVTSIIPSGFGFLVETTTTLHTYTFHRLVPVATQVAAIAPHVVNISAAGANVVDINNFADLYQISTSAPTQRADASSLSVGDLWYDSSSNKVLMIYDGSTGDGFTAATPNASDLANISIVAGQITYTEDLGNITDALTTASGNTTLNTVAGIATEAATVAGIAANVTTVAGISSDVTTVATQYLNVATVAGSISNVNNFANRYRIAGSAPSSSNDEGDLYFDTTSNKLRVYDGSAWADAATSTSGLAGLGANTFTGAQTFASGQTFDGRDVSADGAKLDAITTSSGAILNGVTATTQTAGDNSTKVATTAYIDTATNLLMPTSGGFFVDDVSFSGTNYNAKFNKAHSRFDLNDNFKLTLGTSQDFQIYHDGTYNNFSGANFLVRNAAADETLIYAVQNGAAELWYDNSKKLETTSAGVVVSGNVYANDNNKFIAGTSNDLEIYHDGSNTQVVNNTGDLKIYSSGGALRSFTDQFTVKNVANNETLFYADANSAFAAYYDNSKKFETTSAGVTVTGTVAATSYTGDGSNLSGINTDLVGDTSPQLGGNLDTNSFEIDLDDGHGVRFGNGNDMQLYHSGSHGYLVNTTGATYLQTDYFRIYSANGAEDIFHANKDGTCELYYDNSKKLETTSYGVSTDGALNLNGTGDKIYIADSGKLVFGGGSDFSLQHDGVNNLIESRNGNVEVQINYVGSSVEHMARFKPNLAVELYYDNSKKLETQSWGTSFTGNVSPSADNQYDLGASAAQWNDLYIGNNIYLPDAGEVRLGNSGDLQLYHNGTDSYINDTGTGSLKLVSNAFKVMNAANNEAMIYANQDGAVELYYDNSKKLETTSGGAKVTGFLNVTTGIHIPDGGNSDNSITIGSGNDLRLYHVGSNNNSYITENGSGNLVIGGDMVNLTNAATTEYYIRCTGNAQVELYYDNNKSLETTSDGGVKAQGNYIIGTSGRGLQFNASDSGSSQILDDYEEGTFNPEFGGTSSNGSFTYNSQDGYYTKIGNVVHLQIYVSINQTNSSGSGIAVVKNLPFGVDNLNNTHVGFGYYGGFSGKIPSYGMLNSSADSIYIRRHDPGSSYHQWMLTSYLVNSTFLVLNCTYQTAD